ncbi:MAG: hypothetical protein AB7P52_17690 [Alphaproteobacteria bacterium]
MLKVEEHSLSEAEHHKLLDRLDLLLQFLGAPGDWGYGTELGALTLQLIDVRRRLSAAR